MADVRKYAEGTDVAADKSRAELEALLDKHGATQFAVHKDAERTVVYYRMRERMVRQVVVYPSAEQYKTYCRKGANGKTTRKADEIKKLQEAEWRRLWRAQVLITKAKLEIIASGGSTFENEFLAWMVLPNGDTVAEVLLPKLAEAYATGQMPLLLLGPGDNNG
jgi:hypothetical protein